MKKHVGITASRVSQQHNVGFKSMGALDNDSWIKGLKFCIERETCIRSTFSFQFVATNCP